MLLIVSSSSPRPTERWRAPDEEACSGMGGDGGTKNAREANAGTGASAGVETTVVGLLVEGTGAFFA